MNANLLNFLGDIVSGQAQQPAGGGIFQMLLPMILIFGIFYFLVILPQKKQQKKHNLMIDSLKKGDQVVTTGGIFGRIAEVKESVFRLEIAPKVVITVRKGVVSGKVADEEESKEN